MVTADAVEGTINQTFWFHYDMMNDVLYLRTVASRTMETYADEQSDGTLIIRRDEDDVAVGVTVTDWWKLYGDGAIPDSIQMLSQAIEPFAEKFAA